MLARMAIAVAVFSLGTGLLRVTVPKEQMWVLAPMAAVTIAVVGVGIARLVRLARWHRGRTRIDLLPTESTGSPGYRVPVDREYLVVSTAFNWALAGVVLPGLLRRDVFGTAAIVLTVALLAILLADTISTVAANPSLEIGPSGITFRHWTGGWRADWEALAPHPPRPPFASVPGAFASLLFLPLARADLVRTWRLGRAARRRGRLGIPRQFFDLHPWFLADVIGYYVAHPERRAAIGTEAGYTDLLAALGVTPPAAPVPS
jgi:hypothetical protein